MEGPMFACVYDDGEIASDAQTGAYFASAKTIMICIHRGFGLSKLIRIIIEKANRDPRDEVPIIHFKFQTKVCSSTSNIFQTPAHHNTQRFSPPIIVEVENLGLPPASLEAFSEDEDNILFYEHDDHDQTLDVHPIQQQDPHPQTHVPYHPPQNFQLYEEYNQSPYQECPKAYDHHTMLNDNIDHDVGTLTQGMRFQTKEQLLDALNRYHITNHCTYKMTHSNTTRLRVQCVQQLCP